jgi:hypothetical protein
LFSFFRTLCLMATFFHSFVTFPVAEGEYDGSGWRRTGL